MDFDFNPSHEIRCGIFHSLCHARTQKTSCFRAILILDFQIRDGQPVVEMSNLYQWHGIDNGYFSKEEASKRKCCYFNILKQGKKLKMNENKSKVSYPIRSKCLCYRLFIITLQQNHWGKWGDGSGRREKGKTIKLQIPRSKSPETMIP
jgi:hypothetical protein